MRKSQGKLTYMKNIKGFSQTKLNKIWDSLHSSNRDITASIKVDDELEQVMAVNTNKDG